MDDTDGDNADNVFAIIIAVRIKKGIVISMYTYDYAFWCLFL